MDNRAMQDNTDIRLKVLIVSRRKDTLDALDALLRRYHGVQIERKLVVNGHVDPLHGVATSPDALVLHIGETWRAELESLAARPADRRPPLVVLGSTGDTAAMRLAMQAGARDLLPLPLIEADLIAALARIDRDQRSVSSVHEAAMTLFVNAKGGCGGTFLACNVAHALTTLSGKRVALVDLDIQFGAIPLYFDLFPKRGLMQALENLEGLDETALEGYVVRHSSGLGILGQAAEDGVPLSSAPAELLQNLISIVGRCHDQVVIDLPRRIDPVAVRMIDRSRHIVLVVQQSVTVLRDAGRLMQCLRRELAVSPERIVTVVNRHEKNAAISLDDVRKTLACEELIIIPNDYRSASQCIAAGQPLLEQARTSSLAKAIVALARKLGGDAAAAPHGLLARTFSSLRKARTP